MCRSKNPARTEDESPGADRRWRGQQLLASSRITFISPQVDNTTQTVLAKAEIANSNDSLRTAQFIRARVVWGSEKSRLCR
jgi:multidrug efflux pump subunit AcrA (membrane-fusion protein)